jgi:endonuclease YncB( thermonuclease family)
MKTFTPRLDRFVSWLTIFTLLVIASCMPAFAQDEADTSQVQVTSALSKQEAKRHFVRNHAVTQSDTISVLVKRVIDGDTFICTTCLTCDDSISIRVLELDTFEKRRGEHLSRQAKDWNLTQSQVINKAKEATAEAKKLLEGRQVKLHRGDKLDINLDRYDRPLRYVILPDGRDYSSLMRSRNHDAYLNR